MNTWQTDPVNYVHLNEDGYAAVGEQLIQTAQVPEPVSLVLVGAGVLPLLCGGCGAASRWRA